MDLKIIIIVCTILIVISTANSDNVPCKQLRHTANATIDDLTGSLLYLKYYKTQRIDLDIDGVAYDIKHNGGGNNYTVKVLIIYEEGSKREETFNWTDSSTERKIYINNQAIPTSYTIPHMENNSTAVLYMCATDQAGDHRHFTQVLTTNLDNDLTKALEVARKISPDLTELPFKNKHLFLSYKRL